MENEGSWLLAFPYLPTLPISSSTFILKRSFGPREEDAQRAKSCIVPEIVEMN
jgi:hypothetical protein